MILAAGRGERLRPITDRLPKALVEVGGRPLIEQHIERLVAAGVERIVINLGWLGEQIAERLGSGAQFGARIVYSPEFEQLLDSGGGIHRALPLLGDEPFWVVNADIYTDIKLSPKPLADDLDGELILVANPRHKLRGDFGLDEGKVTLGRERPYTFSGIARYRSRFFAGQHEDVFSIVPLLERAAEEGRLGGDLYQGQWADIGTPERLATVQRRYAG